MLVDEAIVFVPSCPNERQGAVEHPLAPMRFPPPIPEPNSFCGRVWADGQPALDGTVVEAVVEDRVCDRRETASGQYKVTIVVPYCGSPGAIVRFRIDGRWAEQQAKLISPLMAWYLDLTAGAPPATLSVSPACAGPPGFCQTLVDASVTIILGRVQPPVPEHEKSESSPQQRTIVFQDFVVQVERYLRNAMPFERVQVRTWLWELRPDGSQVPPLKDADLQPGEHVPLFLNKLERNNTRLGPDEFTIAGPFSVDRGLAYGKLLVQGGVARTWIFRPSLYGPPQPLDRIIATVEE